MPLVKDIVIDADICQESFRRKDFVLDKDFIRRFEMGKDVSIRTASMKGAQLIESIRENCEPEVKIDLEIQEAYANAEDWLCRRLQQLFHLCKTMGIHTSKMDPNGFHNTMLHDGTLFSVRANQAVLIPVAAFYIGDERVYLFRVQSLGFIQSGKVLDTRNTGVVGYTRDYVSRMSIELQAYMTKLERRAMEDENVEAAFTRLGAMMRPNQYRQQMLEQRAKQYEETNFGDWA